MALLDVFDLSEKVAVVTGGGSGIGEATSTVLAQAGASVLVTDIDVDAAERTVKAITEEGGRASACRVDVSRRADVVAMVDRALNELGGVDIMCNIAGVPCDAPLATVSEEELDRMVGVNVKGVLFGCQAALGAMKDRGGGAIVNVSSTGIDFGKLGNGVYAMTKAAVAMLSMSFAAEAGPFGVRVNAIAPGATLTPFTTHNSYDDQGNPDPARFEQFVDAMKAQSPIGLVGEAIDQALLILYLVSPAARFATGNIFRVNGGESMVW
jgi:3-oxoacyl-[acyl-carrier protein] reductase